MPHIAIPVYYGDYYESRKPLLYKNLEFLSGVECPIFVLAQEWKQLGFKNFNQSFHI